MQMMTGMKIMAKKEEVLSHLRSNLSKHLEIVMEAREGYLKMAEKALKKRLAQLREGRIVALTFRLAPPQDHSETYLTAIQMLELSVSEFIELTAQQVECFIRDKWDWRIQFLYSNSAYSGKARTMSAGVAEYPDDD